MKFKCIKDFSSYDLSPNILPISCCPCNMEEEKIYEGFLTYDCYINSEGKFILDFCCAVFRGDENDVDGYDRRIGVQIISINFFNQHFSIIEE